jgi:hypothetical protein
MSSEIQNLKSEIRNPKSARGFSLMEVLLAVGTLAVGMLFIAGVFPVGIHFTTVSTERTTAAIVADEAFAKIKLYDINPIGLPVNAQVPLENIPLKVGVNIQDFNVFAYPSIPTTDPNSRRYWWSAVCRRTDFFDPYSVQVTVFVSRKTGVSTKYYMRDPLSLPNLNKTNNIPVPLFVSVNTTARPDEMVIIDSIPADGINEATFINDGSTIIDGVSGQIYRVLERLTPPNDYVIRLDKNWQGGNPSLVWVVPPPTTGGRYPCIAVYQKVMRF